MKSTREMLVAVCIMGCVVMGSALGSITYVDAELNNTTIEGAALELGVNYSTNYSDVTDNLWGWRTNRTDVNGGGIWVTDGGAEAGVVDRESTAALKVEMVLPEAGVYNLYAVIMNNNSGDGHWDVATRIGDDGDYAVFNKYSDTISQAFAADFEGNVTVAGGNDRTFKILIGTYTATAANETVYVYVNGLDGWDGSTGLDQRTRFDGLGFETVPEPATLVMLSVGALLGLRRRK